MKIGYIYCYKQPEYIRTRTLKAMLSSDKNNHLYLAQNEKTSFLRYIQTLRRLLFIRIKNKPDVYILAFRGYEIFWPVRLLTLGRPLIFDEFINLHDWVVYEHKKVRPGGIVARLIKIYMRVSLNSCKAILSDTEIHAKSSSETYGIDIGKYTSIYVGTDETIFAPVARRKRLDKNFKVFFYGTFLPLHGMNIILDAAKKLKDKPIEFIIVGGASRNKDMLEFKKTIKKNNLVNVTHKDWVNFEDLPSYIREADLCLGGPFGGTNQAKKVITGKTFQFLSMEKATVVGDISEKVGFIDGQNCLLVQQNDSNLLTTKILWAYKNPYKLTHIAKEGRKLYTSKFSIGSQSDKLNETINTVIS